jgi:NAD(P)-dependent dehydrogenase (short-subunit alcohol dehydrogenase family)
VEDSSLGEFREQIDTDFLGTVRLAKACLSIMRRQGFGRIIAFGAMESRYGMPFHAAFAASKAATEAFCLSMRMEMKAFGVDVCVVSPIDIRTGFTASRKAVSGWTADSPYSATGARALERKERDERRGIDPIKTARLVKRLIAARETKPRYLIGYRFRRFPLGRGWSTALGLAEFFACTYYGLSRKLNLRRKHER